MDPIEQAASVRRGAGLFRLSRGIVEVRGSDAPRWLNGMVSNEVAALDPDGPRSGCYALLLTPQGRILADLHVLRRPEGFWLETEPDAAPAVVTRLDKYVIADDVRLADRSDSFVRLSVEGPAAPAVLEAAAGRGLDLAPDACAGATLGGVEAVIAAFGWSGAPAFQVFAPLESEADLVAALRQAGSGSGLVEAGFEALEILRVEAGTPRLGAELDETVLPDEAGLDRAVSTTKGCYTGQEVVARLRSRGQVSHRLVGLALEETDPLPEPGAKIEHDGRTAGELTSVVRSPAAGPIALGFVRRAHAEPGTSLHVEGRSVRVTPLPFV